MNKNLKIEKRKISRLFEENKTRYLSEYKKLENETNRSSSFILNLYRDQLIKSILEFSDIFEELLPIEKESWKLQVKRISEAAILDVEKLRQIGRIKTLRITIKDIENLKENIAKKAPLLKEYKTLFLSIMHRDNELDKSIKTIFESIDKHIKLQDQKILDIENLLKIMNINLKE